MDAKEETAMNGVWRKGPGKELFEVLNQVSCPWRCQLHPYWAHIDCG